MIAVPEDVVQVYSRVLEQALLSLRMRIQYEDEVTMLEVHDLLDAIHNIPQMLRKCSGWHIPENIDRDLLRYDQKWQDVGNAKLRTPMSECLRRAREER